MSRLIQQQYLDEYRYFGDRIYLDCSTLGMPPERTRKAAREYMDHFSDSLGRSKETQGERIRENTKAELAKLIHADPSDIFFTRNTTDGNNLLARGYPFHTGDDILVCNEDFPAVYMPWTTLQAQGVRLSVVQGKDGVVSADAIIAGFTPNTRAVAVSLAQSSSGYVTDIRKLGRACRERNILLSVDACQAMGRIPVDVEEMNIDVLASASFKGMLGAMGAGFCWCRREVMDQITPPVVSGNIDWQNYDFAEGFDTLPVPGFPSGAARMETGTVNNYGIRLMGESVKMLNEIGVSNIAAQIREAESYYRDRLRELKPQIHMLGSDDPQTWGGSISFLYDEKYKSALETALNEAGIYAAVRRYFRVSLHYYNTCEQIDKLMDALLNVFRAK